MGAQVGLLPKGLRQAQAERGGGLGLVLLSVAQGTALPLELPGSLLGLPGLVEQALSAAEQVLLYACGFKQIIPTGFQLPTQVVYIHIHQLTLPFADFASDQHGIDVVTLH